MDLDLFKFWSNQRLMILFKLIWREWFHSSVKERVLPLDHHIFHLVNIFFHEINKLMNVSDNFHGILDEWVNAWRVPFEVGNTWFKSFVDSLNSVKQQWFFNWKKSPKDLVVDVYNDVKITFLGSVSVHILVQESSFFRYINIEELKIFDFSQESDEDWIKVDSDKAFLTLSSWFFSDKEALVEIVIGLL